MTKSATPRVIRDHIPAPSAEGQQRIQQALAIVRAYTPTDPAPERVQQPAKVG